MSGLDQFKATYITECFELLEEMEELLLQLDTEEADVESLNAIFRCAHSIKGGGGAFGFTRLVNFTHILEFLLDAMREGKVLPNDTNVDALLQSVDIVKQLVAAAQAGEEAPEGIETALMGTLEQLSGGNAHGNVAPSAPVAAAPAAATKESEFFDISFVPHRRLFETGNEPLLIIRELQRVGDVTVKVDSSRLPYWDSFDPDECYLSWKFDVNTMEGIDAINEAFEFVADECDLTIDEFGAIALPSTPAPAAPADEEDEAGGIFGEALATVQQARDNGAPVATSAASAPTPAAPPPANANAAAKPSAAPAVTSIRVDLSKVDNLVNMVGELVITQAMITQQTKDLPHDEFHSLIMGVGELSRHMRELQEAVMAVRMQPVKSIFSRMPRIVRDLSRQLGKNVRLEMKGENTEIDKTVIEQLGDPLTHMLRNSLDHGVEMPAVRKEKGKPEQGVITLSADNSGGRIIIDIEDDGAGINREVVLKKAQEKGLVAPDASLSDEEIDNLIFMPGFSTAAAVTDVSGRGVGMDVVRRNIAELGGTIELTNMPGKGSRISVSLPLTLAILDGMIVRVGRENYIIPINNIIESMRPKAQEIKRVADGNDVINIRGEFTPILYLHKVFDVPQANTDASRYLVVLVETGRNKLGLVVDEIVGQQQVVIKSIEDNADAIEGVSGATILGDGNVSLILDIAQLHKMTASDESRVKHVA